MIHPFHPGRLSTLLQAKQQTNPKQFVALFDFHMYRMSFQTCYMKATQGQSEPEGQCQCLNFCALCFLFLFVASVVRVPFLFSSFVFVVCRLIRCWIVSYQGFARFQHGLNQFVDLFYTWKHTLVLFRRFDYRFQKTQRPSRFRFSFCFFDLNAI